jgi:hypothetical protein
VHGVSSAPFAKLFELDFTSDEFFVFGAPIVNALAFAALEFDESVL